MTYQRIRPCSALADRVEYFGIQVSDDLSDAVTQVLPTNQHDLLIHFADPFVHHEDSTADIEPIAHLCGLRTQPYTVSATGKTGIIICSFFPWAVFELTGVPMHNFTDSTIEAREVFPGISKVIDQMFDCLDQEEQVRLLEQYLANLIQQPNRLVRQAALLLTHSNSIAQVSEQLGLSKRQLDRRFKDAVGLTLKNFARVNRFQQTLGYRLTKLPAATIAASCGFHDQAHMNRELKLMGGSTPGKILSQPDSTPLLSHFNAPMRQMSRFYNTLYL